MLLGEWFLIFWKILVFFKRLGPSPNDAMSHPRRPESLAVLLYDPQISLRMYLKMSHPFLFNSASMLIFLITVILCMCNQQLVTFA